MTVFQNAAGQGKGAVDAALALAAGKPVDKKVYIPFELVTPANMDQCWRRRESAHIRRRLPSWPENVHDRCVPDPAMHPISLGDSGGTIDLCKRWPLATASGGFWR